MAVVLVVAAVAAAAVAAVVVVTVLAASQRPQSACARPRSCAATFSRRSLSSRHG